MGHECVSHATQQHSGHSDSQPIFITCAVDKSRKMKYNIR